MNIRNRPTCTLKYIYPVQHACRDARSERPEDVHSLQSFSHSVRQADAPTERPYKLSVGRLRTFKIFITRDAHCQHDNKVNKSIHNLLLTLRFIFLGQFQHIEADSYGCCLLWASSFLRIHPS